MYTIYGGLGSPYSMKMRALLRYRRLPHVWVQLGQRNSDVYEHVRAKVIPILRYEDGSWHNDSTPMIFDLERLHPGERSVVPDDEAQAFLAFLLEDMADEWGTKAMFFYRWFRDRDQEQMSRWIVFDTLFGAAGMGRQQVLAAAAAFRERQVGRMALVGCTEENAPLIEETARTILGLLEAHVTEEAYLLGSRPSLADFAWMGQLSQLAVDPTPSEMMRSEFPFTYRWLMNLDDASGVEGQWRDAGAPLSRAVAEMLVLAGEVYLPFLVANAEAATRGDDTFGFRALGLDYRQGVFKYQVRCLAELRAAYGRLSPAARGRVDGWLAPTRCLDFVRAG